MRIVSAFCEPVTLQVSRAPSSALLALEAVPEGEGVEGTDGFDGSDGAGSDGSDEEEGSDEDELSARAALKNSTSGTT